MGWDVRRLRLQGRALGEGARSSCTENIRGNVDGFLSKHGLTRERFDHWVAHTGGPKVLEAFASALELPRETLERSWRSLAGGRQPLVGLGALRARRAARVERGARGRPRPADGDGPGLLRRAGAAPMVTTSLALYTAFVAAIAIERLFELRLSKRNAAWALARGAREVGARHFRVMSALHTLFLFSCVAEALALGAAVSPRARLSRARRRARCPGAALLGDLHARARGGTCGSSCCPTRRR